MKKPTLDSQFLKYIKYLNIAFLLFILISCTKEEKKSNSTSFYVGTYTNGLSEGIYQYSISNEGKLSKKGLIAKTEDPSYLVKSNDNKTLLAVSKVRNKNSGVVKAFSIVKDSLLFKNESLSGGANPCFLAINSKNEVLVANYTGGNVGLLKLKSDGNLSELQFVQQHTGKGTTTRQKSPHAHSAWFNPFKDEVISVDLGTNQLWFSKIIKQDNQTKLTEPKKLTFAEGAGPRHLTFHPNNNWIYVLNELNNTVSLVKQKGSFYEIKQTISTLPKDFKAFSKAADIHITKDGKFLYASNRGYNSLAIFKLNDENGLMELQGFEAVKGETPRNFSLTPDNKFIIVANRNSNNLVAFKRNLKTGELLFVDEIEAYNPVCILF